MNELRWTVGEESTKIRLAAKDCRMEMQNIGESIGKQVACELFTGLDKALKDIDRAANNIKLKTVKNVFLSCALTLALLLVATTSVLYVWKFHDGTKIAEMRIDGMLKTERKIIQDEAIAKYKRTLQFKQDACKEVAENISYTNTEYYLFKNIKKSDVKRYNLEEFYQFLKSGAEQYEKRK